MSVIEKIKNHETRTNDDFNEILRLAKIGEKMQWIPVSERLPENSVGKYGIVEPKIVACTNGRTWWQAYYVKKREFNCEEQGSFEGKSDYDEETGEEYWPEGWYECSSENEDIDWALGAKITHWMELPLLPELPKGEGAE